MRNGVSRKPGGQLPRSALPLLTFALRRGGGPQSIFKLFYFTKIKPALIYRGLAKSCPDKIHKVRFKQGGGRPWNVHVRDNGQDTPMLVEYFHEPSELQFEEAAFKPRVIYDLGANIGIASLFFGSIYPEARIFGFEPVPANYEICCRNYSNLKLGHALNCAIGSSSGTMTFEYSSQNLRGGHLISDSGGGSGGEVKRIPVEVWALADLIVTKGLEPPDFLKVDVEGAECEVLNGLGKYADGIKQIHLETHSPELRNKCADWLKANDYRITDELQYTEAYGALWARRQ